MSTGVRNHKRTMRVFYATYGQGPWPCGICSLPIKEMGKPSECGNVHHKDHDPTNDAPENLEAVHAGCHQHQHHSGVRHTPEHNSKVGRKGRVFSDAHRAALSAAQYRRFRSE